MTDLVDTLSITDLGAGALVTLAVLMLYTGRLVTRQALIDLRADRDAWRAAHTVSEEARHVQTGQISAMVEAARTTSHLVDSLHGVTAAQLQDQPPAVSP